MIVVLVLASGWARCGPLVKEQIAVQVPNKRTYYASVYAVHEVVATRVTGPGSLLWAGVSSVADAKGGGTSSMLEAGSNWKRPPNVQSK